MTNVTAGMVKELRDKSGAGMMDCKAALAESNGDVEQAIDWLRKKGLSKAAKKSGRVAAEGLVGVAIYDSTGVLVEVNSETDFVARNEQFQELVKNIAQVALQTKGDVETLKAASYPTGGTVQDAISSAIATIGENMTLRRFDMLKAEPGVVASYIHGAVVENMGKIATLVALKSTAAEEGLTAFGKQIAMHIAASSPLSIDPTGLDPATVTREKAVLADKAQQSGKPPQVIEKIVESGLKTYYKEVCLLEQPFVLDPSKSVAQALKEQEANLGAPIVIAGFLRYGLGEGVEKQEDDFASEVSKMAKTA
ncbi:MAG: translation elongation factor Ts [Pseudomonadota bacterium]